MDHHRRRDKRKRPIPHVQIGYMFVQHGRELMVSIVHAVDTRNTSSSHLCWALAKCPRNDGGRLNGFCNWVHSHGSCNHNVSQCDCTVESTYHNEQCIERFRRSVREDAAAAVASAGAEVNMMQGQLARSSRGAALPVVSSAAAETTISGIPVGD